MVPLEPPLYLELLAATDPGASEAAAGLVSPQTAADTLDHLRAGFTPAEATATGLDAWHYLGGPWRPLTSLPFTG